MNIIIHGWWLVTLQCAFRSGIMIVFFMVPVHVLFVQHIINFVLILLLLGSSCLINICLIFRLRRRQ